MATLSGNALNLVDVTRLLAPDGSVTRVAEILDQSTPLIRDIPMVQGNLPTGHRSTVRTGLPTVAWRLYNQGVQPTKSTTVQVDDSVGMLSAWSECDVKLVALNDNAAEFRMTEATAFIEAMGQEVEQTLFYGNAGSSPEEFTGLAVRYGSTTAANGKNIIAGGGTSGAGDLMSIWLVGWAKDKVFGIYPKGSEAGLQHDDYDQETVEVTAAVAGTRMRAYREQFQWDIGLCVKDWRYVARIPNIDLSALLALGVSSSNLPNLMIRALHRLPNRAACMPVFYMNRSTFQQLDIQCRNDVSQGGQLKYEEVGGVWQDTFRGVPIRVSDQLTEAESYVA